MTEKKMLVMEIIRMLLECEDEELIELIYITLLKS